MFLAQKNNIRHVNTSKREYFKKGAVNFKKDQDHRFVVMNLLIVENPSCSPFSPQGKSGDDFRVSQG